MSDLEMEVMWTLKSVLNVVVKKLVGDWIRLVLFGKKIVGKYTHYKF